MFEGAASYHVDRATAEERLWRAVIARTLEEWVRGPLRYSRIAEKFLFDDNQDFRAVCSSAGMDPGTLRKRLQSIRERGVQIGNRHQQAATPAKNHHKILKPPFLAVLRNAGS
jgi:hypothetical protein